MDVQNSKVVAHQILARAKPRLSLGLELSLVKFGARAKPRLSLGLGLSLG